MPTRGHFLERMLVLELFIGYLLGKGSAVKKYQRDEETKEEEGMTSIVNWESYNQDSRSFEELLAQAKEHARGKQNNQ